MSLLLVGVNHKTAPIEVREQLAFTNAACAEKLPQLVDGAAVREAFLLSTCNRVEILVEGEPEIALNRTIEFLNCSKNFAPADFETYFYQFADENAARHLFRVAASLDSMIVGETQILGQVREAYKIASDAKTAHRVLHKLLHHAFYTAKRVRTETRIANNAVSIASAAVETARKTFSETNDLSGKTVLLVGAGEMAELAAKHLLENGVERILICNRTYNRAVALAQEFAGEVVPFERLEFALAQADIVIASTGAQNFVIEPETVERAQAAKQNRATLFIDIGVPRNISPEIKSLENVFLTGIDDLQTTVSINLHEREREAVFAEAIVEQEVAEFWRSLNAMSFGETLGALRQKMQDTARQELDRQRGKLGDLTPEQTAQIEKLLISTVNQIAHPILYGLRRSHEHGAAEFAETLCELLTSFEPQKRGDAEKTQFLKQQQSS